MVGKFKTIYPSTYFVCHGYSVRPVSSNTDSYILKPALGLQLPGGKIDKCSSICLSVHQSGRPSFLSITNHILSIILHIRRKVLNIGGGVGQGSEYWGGGGGGGGGKGGPNFSLAVN